MLDIQRNWQSKLSNVPSSINVFSCLFLHYVDNVVSIELYRKECNLIESISNLLTLHTVWRVVHSYLGISTSRWAPTSRTGGVLLRAKIIFWNKTSFQKWFLLTDLFYFHMYLLFSSLSFPPGLFPLFIFVIVFCLFPYLIYFYNFLFSTYLFFSFAFRTSLAPTNTQW